MVTNPRITEWPMPETVKSELFPSAVGIEITRPANRLRLFLSPLDKGHFITAFLNRISIKSLWENFKNWFCEAPKKQQKKNEPGGCELTGGDLWKL